MELTKAIKNANKTEVVLIAVLYSIAFGIILFNDGIYHDDWVIFQQDPTLVKEFFKEMGYSLR